MRFDDFALDDWLQKKAGPSILFNFGSSCGPTWSLRDVLALDGRETGERLFDLPIQYGNAVGSDSLRLALGEMAGVPAEHVVVLSGASEALTHVFLAAAEPGANVIVPFPCYPTQEVLPRALGLETRSYHLHRDAHFAIDIEEVRGLMDRKTKLLLVNVPHNPTGATISNQDMEALHDLAVDRGIQFVCDEVHRPIFHGQETHSGACLEHATTIGDFSKAFSMPGLRLGWIIEPNPKRRASYRNSREYVSICNSPITEFVAEVAVRHRSIIYERTRRIASHNLELLDEMFSRNSQIVGWVRPAAGMTSFPWLRSGENARQMCLAAAEKGILLVPGDCMGAPEHFRVCFGCQTVNFQEACESLEAFLCSLGSAPDGQVHRT